MTPLDWYINDNYQTTHITEKHTRLIDADNPLSAIQQLASLGFPFAPPSGEWQLTADHVLVRTGAPPLPPAAYALHLGEQIFIYPFNYVAVVRLDGGFTLFHLD